MSSRAAWGRGGGQASFRRWASRRAALAVAGGLASLLLAAPLGLLFNLSGTLVNVGVALAASFVGVRLPAHPDGSAHFRWLTGSVFVGPGLRLALSGRN